MKRNYNILLLVLLLAFASCSFTTKTFSDPDKDKLLVQVITYVLQQGHFDPKDLDDEFSKAVFEDYLQQLDPFKRYFLKSDIEEFKKFETQIDDQLKEYDISFFNLTHERVIQRMNEVKTSYKELLAKPFDYTLDEDFNSDYENLDYVKNKRERNERWRKQLKFATISNYDGILELERLAKEKDTSYEMKSLADVEKETREETLSSIDNYFNDYIDDLNREDWFSMYINAIVQEFDPHTTYFAPRAQEGFEQLTSGKLEGIGARLQKTMGNTKIIELISGGPAWRGKELEVGDFILKVRQEDEEQPVNIVGMRLDDAIKYIKGPKGTEVTLTIKKVDGTIKDITIIRDVVELEETYAKSSTVKKDGKTFGVIDLPKFYIDFNDYKSRNAATDVRKEIEHLKAQGIEGLVLDLRNNGGGSLPVVVDLAGLFIKDGPIVQVRSTGAPKEVLKDKDRSIVWDGPLVILVNELSASASEILAAAMQDYKRAIVIGSKQTFGKGTVQNYMDLNRVVRNADDLGAIKVTTQKYYRINGGSVQLEGVKSDIVVPDRYSYVVRGEKDYDGALPWDEISAAEFTLWNSYFDYDATIEKSKERMQNSDQLKLIEDNAKWVKTRMDNNNFSLNYEKYKARLDKSEEEAKRFERIGEYQTNLTFEALPYEKEKFEADTALKEKRERWYENLSKDVYMEEALNILEDLKMTYEIKKVADKVKD